MQVYFFEVTMCALIAVGGFALIILTKLVDKWCDAKGIVLEDDEVYEDE